MATILSSVSTVFGVVEQPLIGLPMFCRQDGNERFCGCLRRCFDTTGKCLVDKLSATADSAELLLEILHEACEQWM